MLSADDDIVSGPEESPAPVKNASSAPKETPVTKPAAPADDEYVLCVKGTKKETKDKSGIVRRKSQDIMPDYEAIYARIHREGSKGDSFTRG